MMLDEIRGGYHLRHNRIEFALNNVRNAGLRDYNESKKQLVEVIELQIEFLNKMKEELKK